jgi:hypothetical protein
MKTVGSDVSIPDAAPSALAVRFERFPFEAGTFVTGAAGVLGTNDFGIDYFSLSFAARAELGPG